MSENKKSRNYGIDLLRIFSMFLVVILHVLRQGGLLLNAPALSIRYEAIWAMESFAFCAVNCFALVSGFVGAKARFKYANIINLWITVFFYHALFTVIYFAVSGQFDWGTFRRMLFPVAYSQYWYFSAYFGMFFFIPVLNHLINTMEIKQLKMAVLSSLVLFSGIPLISNHTDAFTTLRGYSMLWLCVMYVLGGYIQRTGWHLRISGRKAIGAILISWAVTVGWKLLVETLGAGWMDKLTSANLLIEYTSPTIVVISLAWLSIFAKLQIKGVWVKMIAFFSPLCFSVYLIHTQQHVFKYVMKNIARWLLDYPSYVIVPGVLLLAVGIFLVCCFIDKLRMILFKWLRIDRIGSALEARLRQLLTK